MGRDGCRCYSQSPTAVVHDGCSATVPNRGGPWRLGSVCFKKSLLFCMNSDGDKLYKKLVAFDEIYTL
jgi:hypothetical protein